MINRLNHHCEGSKNYQANQKLNVDYYTELSNHADHTRPEILKNCMHNIIIEIGFTDYAFINVTRADILQPMLNTFPDSLLREYHNKALFTNDMVLQRVSCSALPFFSSTVHDYIAQAPFVSSMTQCMNTISDLQKAFGFYDCFHVPIFFETARDFSTDFNYLLSVTTRGESPVDFRKKTLAIRSSLVLLGNALSRVVSHRMPSVLPRGPVSINSKPLQVLYTLANNDMTIDQVAKKLCVSVVTINHHLKTVRQSLGVKTNYAAIKRAVLDNLIKLEKTPKYD